MYDEALWLDLEGAEYEGAELDAEIERLECAEFVAECERWGIDPIAEMEVWG